MGVRLDIEAHTQYNVYRNVYREVREMRTNIVIDDDLMDKAITVSGLKSKKEVVNVALEEFIQRHSQKNLLDLAGKIQFADDYDYKAMREGRTE